MKNTMKIFLVAALFCTSALADGDMGSGGRTCPVDPTQPCVGDMGSGGKSAPTAKSGRVTVIDSMIIYVRSYVAPY